VRYRIPALLTLGLLSPAILIGCASIVGNSKPEVLSIRSTPDQADILITDETENQVFSGKTPTIVSLEKKKGYFSGKKYTVTIAKPGFTKHTVAVNTSISGWYIGNVIFGGLIGLLIVDPLTGAMWTLDTNEININMMDSSSQTGLTDHLNINVVLLQDIPIDLKAKMVKVQ
jgi:hypothetical protein